MFLFKLSDNIYEAVDEIVVFYRRYHSMRYVGPLLVLRLSSPLPPGAIERLNDTYASILTGGRIEEHVTPLEGEGDEAEYPGLPRLSLAYNRKDAGTVRLLINDINAA